jgi:DNA-binding transcriptional LysR family regulator
LNAIKAFEAAARLGSFTRAAEESPAPPGSRFDRMIAELARRSANSSTFHRRRELPGNFF